MTRLDTTLHYMNILAGNCSILQPELRKAINTSIRVLKLFQESQALKLLLHELDEEEKTQ